MTTARPPVRRSLRSVLLLALLPLCAMTIAGVLLVLRQAATVHTDVLRLFEENHEQGLARSLLEELRGIEQWVKARDSVTAAARDLVRDDQLQHLAQAEATLPRFSHNADDPSRPEHSANEERLFVDLRAALGRLRACLATSAGDEATALTATMRAAERLAADIDHESRELGHRMDQSSEDMVRWLVLFGIGSAATLALLSIVLARRVLGPVARLHLGAMALGQGQLGARLPAGRDDELGALAGTFNAMAARLQATQQDLEARVEERSREVLRTARLAELGTLAAGIAHEINNPLASIAACAEGLLRTPDGPPTATDLARTREYLAIVAKEAMRARDITTRLLDFARQDPGRREPMTFDDPVREVVAMFAHQAAQRQIAIAVTGAAGTFLGNGAEWRQVMHNLLKNALDATAPGGDITIELGVADGHARMSIGDRGPGIPRESREQVFEPFFTTKPPGAGTGLGLSIVHRIVTAHGGHVVIGERPGGGASIEIEVPLAG
ncbi:MAG: HAMP domain-containing histidine kinase [Planctomycetes bacterium]|nr:HAMP domain-containing histidine kinase [Planctomycetota bacterium]